MARTRRTAATIQEEYVRIIKNEKAFIKLLKEDRFLSFEEFHNELLTRGYKLNSPEYLIKISNYLEGVL